MTDEKKEKMTALIPSVGADGGQSPLCNETILTDNQQDSNHQSVEMEEMEAWLRQVHQMNSPNYLHTVSLTELYDTVYRSRIPVIENLLYTGAYILAGAPKIGKSFLVAQFAHHVSTGQPIWEYEIKQPGAVLYLALEDDYQRLQERMARMFGVESDGELFFAVSAKQVGNGLDEQLAFFLREHPNTRLVIVDTLQKVREMSGDIYSYAGDYEIISRLKAFGEQNGVCVLIVHHTRKQPAGDSFETISGTIGLLGCADGAILMQKEKRTDNKAALDIVGRDQPDQKIHLIRDEVTLQWNFEKAERQLWKEPPDPILTAVAKLVTAECPQWKGSATELAEALRLSIQPNALSKKLNVKAGKLIQGFGIRYENNRSRTGSNITLTLVTTETTGEECAKI